MYSIVQKYMNVYIKVQYFGIFLNIRLYCTILYNAEQYCNVLLFVAIL